MENLEVSSNENWRYPHDLGLRTLPSPMDQNSIFPMKKTTVSGSPSIFRQSRMHFRDFTHLQKITNLLLNSKKTDFIDIQGFKKKTCGLIEVRRQEKTTSQTLPASFSAHFDMEKYSLNKRLRNELERSSILQPRTTHYFDAIFHSKLLVTTRGHI